MAPQGNGYYHRNGYMQPMHSGNRYQYGYGYQSEPPLMERNYSNETNYPPPPIVDSFDDCLPPKIDENEGNIANIPPPPALEALDIETKTVSNGKTENENVEIEEIEIGQVMDTNGVETNRILSPVSKGNTAEIVETLNENEKESNGQNVEQNGIEIIKTEESLKK